MRLGSYQEIIPSMKLSLVTIILRNANSVNISTMIRVFHGLEENSNQLYLKIVENHHQYNFS